MGQRVRYLKSGFMAGLNKFAVDVFHENNKLGTKYFKFKYQAVDWLKHYLQLPLHMGNKTGLVRPIIRSRWSNWRDYRKWGKKI
jgi:hypothetical protein